MPAQWRSAKKVSSNKSKSSLPSLQDDTSTIASSSSPCSALSLRPIDHKIWVSRTCKNENIRSCEIKINLNSSFTTCSLHEIVISIKLSLSWSRPKPAWIKQFPPPLVANENYWLYYEGHDILQIYSPSFVIIYSHVIQKKTRDLPFPDKRRRRGKVLLASPKNNSHQKKCNGISPWSVSAKKAQWKRKRAANWCNGAKM